MNFHLKKITPLENRENKCEKLIDFLFEWAIVNNNKNMVVISSSNQNVSGIHRQSKKMVMCGELRR